MSQLTAKTVDEALRWIETTPHHKAEWIGPWPTPTHFVLSGHGERLRIPAALQRVLAPYLTAGGQLDARMYRASAAGKARLTRATKAEATAHG